MSVVHRLENRGRRTAWIAHGVEGSRERRGPWSFLSNAHCLLHEGPADCGLSWREEAV